MKIESVYQIRGRGTVLGCTPTTQPHPGSILRHTDGRVWLITAVERFCVPWSPGQSAGLHVRPAAEGQAEPVEGDDVEMVEPLALAAWVAGLEARIASLEALRAIGDRQEALANHFAARCEALEAGLAEALDGWVVEASTSDWDAIARLRALAAGAPPTAGEEPAR